MLDPEVTGPTGLYDTAAAAIAEGDEVAVVARGASMEPFVADGDTVTLGPADAVAVDDIVLARDSAGHVVMHAVTAIDGDTVTLMGTANLQATETCRTADIAGRAMAYYRRGRRVDTAGGRHRAAMAVWRRALRMRRWLLAAWRMCRSHSTI